MPVAALSPAEYAEILLSHLVPLFPGAKLQDAPITDDSEETVVQENAGSLLVKPDKNWPYAFRLRRTYPFEKHDVNLAMQFTRALREKLVASRQPFFSYLIDQCAQDAVAGSVQHRAMDGNLLPLILTTLKKWASETYEGQRISVTIGVDPAPQATLISNLHFTQILGKDFAKVLSNGLDTMLILSPSGHIVEHLTLRETGERPRHVGPGYVAPHRLLPLASWSSGSRVALSLNRHGEILVFNQSSLRFAFRRGKWSHFAHPAMIARMTGSDRERSLIQAVYATCLDISFSRTGGCIAVEKRGNKANHSDYLNDRDLLSLGSTDKSALVSHLVGTPFPSIPRPLREELAALDGAIVLAQDGTVLAAGAIVRVPGGSDGGGRRAAAKELSRLGLAVKVSADGGITAFTDGGTRQNPEIAFEVCV